MKREIILEFSELQKNATIELDESKSPITVRSIIDALPINIIIERWGDELYSEPTTINIGEENSKTEVDLFDIAFWPEGKALCFFYGCTPLSRAKILPYSAVNVIGKIKTVPEDIPSFLNAVQDTHVRKRVAVVLRKN